jgi:hypothetical protein
MARIIVTTEQGDRPDRAVLLDEWIYPTISATTTPLPS